MSELLQLNDLKAIELWARLQEVTLRKSEISTWLSFYEQHLLSEKDKYQEICKKEKTLRSEFEKLSEKDIEFLNKISL